MKWTDIQGKHPRGTRTQPGSIYVATTDLSPSWTTRPATIRVNQGAGFISVIETGRFAYWTRDEEERLSDGWWFWQQCEHCGYEVPASATVSTPTGREPMHDDRLISAALVSLYDELVLTGLLRTERGKATVIRAEEPADDMQF